MTHEIYLGDGVYADIIDGMIALTTTNGLHETNTIYLESEVWNNLLEYVKTKKENN